MMYKLRSGEDALFDLEDGRITLASRGGSAKKSNAVNPDYSKALRIILDRVLKAGLTIQDAYVDSSVVQKLSIPERRIVDLANMPVTVSELFTMMSQRMQHVGQDGEPRPGNANKRIAIQLSGQVTKKRLIELLGAVPVDSRAAERLPADELRKVTAADLWRAREVLLESRAYAPFDDSDGYDVLLEDDQRLPPKALLGHALTKTLGFQVQPKHFTGGESSTCFAILREHGYEVVPKGESAPVSPTTTDEHGWPEGDKKGRWHLRSERRSGLAAAKKDDFIASHGKLFCERCGLDPVTAYDAEYADACIEVHHANVAVADMQPGHKTKLTDLQCLCANCHRVEHRRMRKLNASR